MKVKLSFYKQDTGYTCGPASLQMVLSFFHDHKSEADIARKAHTKKDAGTKHKWMINVAEKEGFYCYVNNNSSIEEIRDFIESGLPVIVHFTEPSGNDSHYSVITGFSKGKIIMNDPWNGRGFKIRKADFLSRWHGSVDKNNCKKWVMVISKEDFNIGKQYLPK